MGALLSSDSLGRAGSGGEKFNILSGIGDPSRYGIKGAAKIRRECKHDKQPCPHCGVRYTAYNGAIEKHIEKCSKNPENRKPEDLYKCRTCGVQVPFGASHCWAHENKDPRFAELNALIEVDDRAKSSPWPLFRERIGKAVA